MATCFKSGQALPERSVYLGGFECREKDKEYCPYYSHIFIDGVNCRLLRRPVDVRAVLGIHREGQNV